MLIRGFCREPCPLEYAAEMAEFVARANFGFQLVSRACAGLRVELHRSLRVQGHFDVDPSDLTVAFNANLRFAPEEDRSQIVGRLQ